MNLGAQGKQIKTINARLQYKKIIKLRSSGSVKIVVLKVQTATHPR